MLTSESILSMAHPNLVQGFSTQDLFLNRESIIKEDDSDSISNLEYFGCRQFEPPKRTSELYRLDHKIISPKNKNKNVSLTTKISEKSDNFSRNSKQKTSETNASGSVICGKDDPFESVNISSLTGPCQLSHKSPS